MNESLEPLRIVCLNNRVVLMDAARGLEAALRDCDARDAAGDVPDAVRETFEGLRAALRAVGGVAAKIATDLESVVAGWDGETSAARTRPGAN